MKSPGKSASFGHFSLQTSKLSYFFLGWILGILAGCGAQSVADLHDKTATEGFSLQETDKLFVVDCLLPGQIRKLGSQMTYQTARRPIKTTAADCEIRGGEYVAYDRSDTASALRVWLPKAQEGDADAQVNVGEIYEKGPIGIADPMIAAQWYLKAAEQGSSRAQINLGYLYEKGLGVKQDKAAAINWYRKASGLANADLQFATVLEADYQKQLEEIKEESEGYKEEAKSLREQLERTRQQLEEQKLNSRTIDEQLNNIRNKLKDELKQSKAPPRTQTDTEEVIVKPEIKTVAKKDRQNEQQIIVSQNRLADMEANLKSLETEYHANAAMISLYMNTIDEKSQQANTTQEKLYVETLREKLSDAKNALSMQGEQIKETKNALALEQQTLEKLQKLPDLMMANAGPVIEIIDPPMTLTRGEPSYQLISIEKTKEIIGKISSRSGLKSLDINQQPVQTGMDGIFKSEIAIEDTPTVVKIIAIDNQNQRSMVSFKLLAPNQETMAAVNETPVKTVSNAYPSIKFGSFHALIIGNNKYANMPTLKTSVNDAKAVNEILRMRYGYKTKLLIDANRHQIMTAFDELRQKLTDQDNLLIYYAGHGDIDKSGQSAYWLPTDAEDNNTANWLSSINITNYLNVIPAKHILVIADSCYSGALTQGSIVRLPDGMPEIKREKWLNFMVKRKARTVMTSGGEEPVLDTGGGNHSVFANALLKALKSNKGLMVDYELYSRIANQVKKSASSIGFRQVPQYSALQHAGHEGSPFFFVPKI